MTTPLLVMNNGAADPTWTAADIEQMQITNLCLCSRYRWRWGYGYRTASNNDDTIAWKLEQRSCNPTRTKTVYLQVQMPQNLSM